MVHRLTQIGLRMIWIVQIVTQFVNCKLKDADPVEWLTDILNRLPDHSANLMEELLPHLWKKIEARYRIPDVVRRTIKGQQELSGPLA